MNILATDGTTYTVEIDGAIHTVAIPHGEDPYEAIPAILAEAAEEREPGYRERRAAEYPPIREQLDMIFHDIEGWRKTIADIKARHPRDVT